MNARQMIAIVLIAAGVAGLVYGSFSFTKEKHEAKVGSLSFSITDKECGAVNACFVINKNFCVDECVGNMPLVCNTVDRECLLGGRIVKQKVKKC